VIYYAYVVGTEAYFYIPGCQRRKPLRWSGVIMLLFPIIINPFFNQHHHNIAATCNLPWFPDRVAVPPRVRSDTVNGGQNKRREEQTSFELQPRCWKSNKLIANGNLCWMVWSTINQSRKKKRLVTQGIWINFDKWRPRLLCPFPLPPRAD
jgi:hypothetical protein